MTDFAFSPHDDGVIASGSQDGTVKVRIRNIFLSQAEKDRIIKKKDKKTKTEKTITKKEIDKKTKTKKATTKKTKTNNEGVIASRSQDGSVKVAPPSF